MVYSKAFFALQLDLAKTVGALVELPRDQALLDYTNFYIRFGLGRDFDHGHPVWRRFVDGLTRAADVCDWTYRFYLAQGADLQPPDTSTCFSYAMQDPECVRIHFRNAGSTTDSPLSRERLPARLAELRAIFREIRRDRQQVTHVVGTSWLYNLPAYQRCFPAPYIDSARIAAPPRYRHISLWGQFLDRTGSLRHDVMHEFNRRLARLTKLEDLRLAFPMHALAVEGRIEDFYRFYRISADG